MEILLLVGRLFFALLFIGSGIGHLRQTAAMAGYASSKGVPAAKAARMSKSQIKSAVRRKRSKKQGVGGKPTMVRTAARRKGRGR